MLSEVKIGSDMTMQFSLWGKNITDEEYRQNTIPFGLWTASFVGDPATDGASARLNFWSCRFFAKPGAGPVFFALRNQPRDDCRILERPQNILYVQIRFSGGLASAKPRLVSILKRYFSAASWPGEINPDQHKR
jgi:hypothetical protein